MRTYDLDFDNLSVVDRLELLMSSPQLAAVADVLPSIGSKTKPSLTDTRGTLIVGAASFLFGNDRKADAELRSQWDRIKTNMHDHGIAAPDQPLKTNVFRRYRDTHIKEQDVLNGITEVFRQTSIGMAQQIGLFGETDPETNTLLEPSATNTLYADGTYYKAASETRPDEEGRSVPQADTIFKGYGHNHVFFFARGPKKRSRLVLAVAKEVGGAEMGVVVDQSIAIKSLLGDRLHGLVYDGALCGDHKRELAKYAIPTINKPDGTRTVFVWRHARNTAIGRDAHIFDIEHDGCVHRTNLTDGVWWQLERGDVGAWYRKNAIEYVDARQIPGSFELDLALPCPNSPGGFHIETVDAMARLKSANKKGSRISIPDQTSLIAMNNPLFRKIYGIRNDSESHFQLIKHCIGNGLRAQSFNVQRHELDLILASMAVNAAAWTEHGPRNGKIPPGYGATQRHQSQIDRRRAA